MLRITGNSSVAGAKSYYSTADYYIEGKEQGGVWRGRGAAMLGLDGAVDKKSWDLLCENRDPMTGKRLTARTKDKRRVGYDFTFNAPKSLSLLYGLTGDERLLDAFRTSVDETMRDIESEMKCRVRKDGKDENRVSGNLVWGEFIHYAARPVQDGLNDLPDPHLHAHCFAFNVTHDTVEHRWKAGQFGDLKRDGAYFEALFHARLAGKVAELGLPVERTAKRWTLTGVSPATVQKFSRRTAEIEAEAARLGITDPKVKDQLGAKTRKAKAGTASLAELRNDWTERLTLDEVAGVVGLADAIGGAPNPLRREAAKDAIDWAKEHCFERASVVPERTLATAALRQAPGLATSSDVLAELGYAKLLRAEREGQEWVTTPRVLAEERQIVAFARNGRGACSPLVSGEHTFARESLSDEQRRAVLHVIHSRDRVIAVRGIAGTGKTFAMQEAAEAIAAEGRQVFAFAPSSDASRGVLRRSGFPEADTVAMLLKNEQLQERARGQVIWVDEASLLGSKAMGELFAVAGRLDARVVLQGDRKQHGSVERGTVLRLLEQEAGLLPATLKDIRRQKGDYKLAVAALSEGRVVEGFKRLDALGWIKEISDGQTREAALAADYLAAVKKGETALIVSPTHAEGRDITTAVRDELKQMGRIGSKDREVFSLVNLRWTQAERRDPARYMPNDVVVFMQNARGHKKGERIVIGPDAQPPVALAERFNVFRAETIPLTEGDCIRITTGATTKEGHRVDPGNIYNVAKVGVKGDVTLANGWVLPAGFGHLTHGYVVTSHASQGKTVDRVLIGQSGTSFGASSREQIYVSVSRGRRSATVYTDSKLDLLEAVHRCDDRMSATELVRMREREAEQRREAARREEATKAAQRERELERA